MRLAFREEQPDAADGIERDGLDARRIDGTGDLQLEQFVAHDPPDPAPDGQIDFMGRLRDEAEVEIAVLESEGARSGEAEGGALQEDLSKVTLLSRR